MPLSALLALVRLDVDPWEEAANLTRLPAETATQRLASLIAALPDGPSAHPDPGTIAARLITLLPGRASSNVRSRETLLGVDAVTNFRARRPPAQSSQRCHRRAQASDDQVGCSNRKYYDRPQDAAECERPIRAGKARAGGSGSTAEPSECATAQPDQRAAPGRRALFRDWGSTPPKLNPFIGQNRFLAHGY
jgi:hypothetical protein